MKRATKKLTIQAETLRMLANHELCDAHGGAPPVSTAASDCGFSCTCPRTTLCFPPPP